MKNELKIVRIGTNQYNYKRIYLHNGKYISIDTFNNILDGWDFMGYDIKKYEMHRGNQHIFVWYVK